MRNKVDEEEKMTSEEKIYNSDISPEDLWETSGYENLQYNIYEG